MYYCTFSFMFINLTTVLSLSVVRFFVFSFSFSLSQVNQLREGTRYKEVVLSSVSTWCSCGKLLNLGKITLQQVSLGLLYMESALR